MKKRTRSVILAAMMITFCLTGCAKKEETGSAVSQNDAINSYESEETAPVVENATATELTRIRCYEVAGYLAEATGKKIDLEVPRV